MELSSPIKLLSLLKLRAEQLKKGKPREQRLKDEPERFPKGFFHRNLPFYKGLSNGTRGLICQLPRRGIKSPGDKTGWKTLNNLNRKETGKPFKQTRGWRGKAMPFIFALYLPGAGLAVEMGAWHFPRCQLAGPSARSQWGYQPGQSVGRKACCSFRKDHWCW